jgi:AcrR family transcriptional regulator
MANQSCITKVQGREGEARRRRYRMRRRAEHVDETRRRITQAAVKLHTTVGPSRASIAAIAKEAGVTRLTVYRHFADPDALFAACMNHWESCHPAPDPAAWTSIDHLEERARVGLRALYAWYREVADDLTPIHRDLDHLTERARARMAASEAALAATIAGETAETSGARLTRAVAAHLVRFETWRSLVVDQGLSLDEAVETGTSWLVAVANSAAARHA